MSLPKDKYRGTSPDPIQSLFRTLIDKLSAITGITSLSTTDRTIVANSGITIEPTHFSPQHFSVAFTTTSTITCTPLGSLPAIDGATMNIVSVKIDKVNNTSITYINGKDGIKMTASANVISIYKDGILQTPFADDDTKYRVSINYMNTGEDPSTDTLKVTVENYPVQPVASSLVDGTSNSGITYYPSSDGIEMGSYRNFSINGKITNTNAVTTTLTIEATNDEDLSTGEWHQIYFYNYITDSFINSLSITTATSMSFALMIQECNWNNVRVKVSYGDSSNTAIIKMRRV